MQIKDIKRGLCFNRVTKSGKLTCNLVIAVSDFNVTYVSIERLIKYEFIDGCKLTGEIWNGMSACIDRIISTPVPIFMKEISNNIIAPAGYLSQKQMIKIVAAVIDYLSGNLVFSSTTIKHRFEIDDNCVIPNKNTNNEENKSHIYEKDSNSVNSNDHYNPNVIITAYNNSNNDDINHGNENNTNSAPQVDNVEVPQNNDNIADDKQTEEEPPIEKETRDENTTAESKPDEEINEEKQDTDEDPKEEPIHVEEASKEEETAQIIKETSVESVHQNFEEDNGDRIGGVMIIKDKEPKTPEEAISEYIPIEINPVTGEKWYDLTADCNNKINLPKKNRKDYPAKKSKKNTKDISGSSEVDLFRHLYSESEVRIIAISSIKNVMSKYKVTNNIAYMLCRNARKIMNIDCAISPKENNFADFFNEGYTPEELIEVLGNDMRSNIMKSYNRYMINKNSTIFKMDIEAKYKEIVDNGRDNIAFIDQVYKMSYPDIAKMEKCTISSAIQAKFIIEEYLLSRYIQYYIGGDYTTTADSFKDDKVGLAVFNKAIQLKDAVIRSYRNHIDIANGVKPIPNNVPEDDKEFYMALIINRLCKSGHSLSNMLLTDTQKNIIDSANKKFNRETKMMAFMWINYKSIGYLVSNTRRSIKKKNASKVESYETNAIVEEALAATV